MNRDRALALAKTLKMDISDDVVNNIIEKHEDFMKKIDLLKAIDTEGIEPMHRVDETETFFIREDVEGEVLPVEVITGNAPKKEGNFVSIIKVVK